MDGRQSFPFLGLGLFSVTMSFWGGVYHDSGSYLQGAPNIAPSGIFVFFTKNERVGRHKVHPSGSSGECFFLRLHSLVFEKSFMSFWCYFCFMKCYWRDRMLYLIFMKPFLASNGDMLHPSRFCGCSMCRLCISNPSCADMGWIPTTNQCSFERFVGTPNFVTQMGLFERFLLCLKLLSKTIHVQNDHVFLVNSWGSEFFDSEFLKNL